MQIIQKDCGATLIEQLGALLLGTIIITALFGFYRTELFHLLAQETRMATLEDARGAMDIISRDLKLAGSWGAGSPPAETHLGDDPDGDEDAVCNRVYRATGRMIQIQMDLNGNGNCADIEPRENIRYELGAPTTNCPGATVIRRNGDCLVAYASRHGATAEIAEALAQALRRADHDAEARLADHVETLDGYDRQMQGILGRIPVRRKLVNLK